MKTLKSNFETRLVYVYVELNGSPILAGKLSESKDPKKEISFQYASTWLSSKERFALEPALPLNPEIQHPKEGLKIFGVFVDAGPDRWGRLLMRRAATRLARASNKEAEMPSEIDYLMGVYDDARLGALRFSETIGGLFLQCSTFETIPSLTELPKLLTAAGNIIADTETDEDLKLLLIQESSLGGINGFDWQTSPIQFRRKDNAPKWRRPKALIRDCDGQLALAKFLRKDDRYYTVLWEAVCLALAAHAGFKVPSWRVEFIGNQPVLIVKRFDRQFTKRIPFLSAQTLIGASDNDEKGSYLEIGDAIAKYGAFPKQDRFELWKRMVFNILISNSDDHLANHAFLYEKNKGWKLSPLYDVNPVPVEIKPRILYTTIVPGNAAMSLDLALSVAKEFGVNHKEAKKIVKTVGKSVNKWRKIARNLRIPLTEIDRMASAFVHEDLLKALSG